MRASVVVPTRNRAARLDALLHSLAGQTIAASDFEILVVDNGSTDHTPDVVSRWAAWRPGLRGVVEPQPGVSRARNAGIAAAGGPVIAFLDDDVVADPGWLEALLHAYDRWPAAGIVCGRGDLLLEAPPPRWFGPEVAGWYSVLDFGPQPRMLEDPGDVPWALNLSARSEVARAVHGFPEHLGRTGDDMRGGEEAPFVSRARAAGWLVAYDPGARVQHVVSSDRLRLRWLLRRAWGGGLDAHETAAASGQPLRPGVAAGVGRVLFRGWREATRRLRRTRNVREALLVELCHRIAGVAAVWGEYGDRATPP